MNEKIPGGDGWTPKIIEGGLSEEQTNLHKILRELKSFARGIERETGMTVDGVDAPEDLVSEYMALDNASLELSCQKST